MVVKHGSMYDSLAGLRNRIHPKPRRERSNDGMKDPSPSPMEWKGDGIDHINIWIHAETDLGRFLALDSDLPVNHSYFGRFCSVETFWYYIQSEERDDRIRTMFGKTLKSFVRRLNRQHVVNFRAMIADTMYQRIQQYPPLLEAVKNSVLPFDYYRFDNRNEVKIPIRPNFFKWLLSALEEIRKAVKEGREPNFGFLMDSRKMSIYESVLPKRAEKVEETLVEPEIVQPVVAGISTQNAEPKASEEVLTEKTVTAEVVPPELVYVEGNINAQN